jgi:hypothetical protein
MGGSVLACVCGDDVDRELIFLGVLQPRERITAII